MPSPSSHHCLGAALEGEMFPWEGRAWGHIPAAHAAAVRVSAPQEVCYLCMQQQEQRLRAARLEEAERQERAEWAEHEACRARTAALNAQVLEAFSAAPGNGLSSGQLWRCGGVLSVAVLLPPSRGAGDLSLMLIFFPGGRSCHGKLRDPTSNLLC